MEVILAKSAGFCFGVKRAVDMVYLKAAQEKRKVYTLGPIIHNEEVVKDLENKGIKVLTDISELQNQKDAVVIIRAHGISKKTYDELKKYDIEVVDATCPFVKKIHNIVDNQAKMNHNIIVIGKENHPEVAGITGWSDGKAVVIETEEEALKYEASNSEPVCIVSQTTFNYKKFEELVEIISKKGYDILAMNTICNATEERQTEAGILAKKCDAMIVIGGKQSSNTQKLYDICKKDCKNTYFIQTLEDLDVKEFQSFRSIGITAGASTPNNIIQEVLLVCQK